ncbi:MAG: sensor histidine kinase [Flavobacteriales bacterium]|nr:sensor histidine kinase [Flavobacteriales bacterium]
MLNSPEPAENLTIYIALILFAVLALALTIILLFFVSRKKISQKKLEAQALKLKHKSDLIIYNIETQEMERQRIAQDLHDDIGSQLNLISLGLHRLQKVGSKIEQEETDAILLLTEGVIDRVRSLSHELLPPILEKFGLIAALQEVEFNYNKINSIQLNFKTNIDDEDIYVDLSRRLHLYRICQELIQNSLKHGKAKCIRMSLLGQNDTLILSFNDDGVGFDVNKLDSGKGMGLMNIENRVEMLHGTMSIESELHEGSSFQIRLPKLEKDERDH